MSRIGKMPVTVPKGVKVELSGQHVKVAGPKGALERTIRSEIGVEEVDGALVITRRDDSQQTNAFQGMERALINNMVMGVLQGYEKQLHLQGVGYRVDLKGTNFELGLGYSHSIDFPLPKGITGSVLKEGRELFIKLEGIDKQLVGQTAAQIRALRPPEPYKGKGVRYRDEVVKRKAGKAGK